MDYSIDRTSTTDDSKNNKKITFDELAPNWSKRLDKLIATKGTSHEKDLLYDDLNDYKKCIVGEAYGYNPSYVLYGTNNHCIKCTGFSRDFVYALKVYDLDKLSDTKQKLTDHWSEVHIDITERLRHEKGGKEWS